MEDNKNNLDIIISQYISLIRNKLAILKNKNSTTNSTKILNVISLLDDELKEFWRTFKDTNNRTNLKNKLFEKNREILEEFISELKVKDEAEDKLNILIQERTSKESQLEKKNNEIVLMEEKINLKQESIKAKNNQKEKNLELILQKRKELHEEYEILQREKEKLKNDLYDQKKYYTDHNSFIEKIENSKRKYQDKKNEKELLKKSLKDLNNDLENNNNLISKMKNKISNLDEKQNQLRNGQITLKEEKNNLEDDLIERRQKLISYDTDILIKERTKLLETNEENLEQMKIVENTKNKNFLKLENVKINLQNQEKSIQELKNDIKMAKDQIKSEKMKKIELEHKLKNKNDQIEELNKNIQEMKIFIKQNDPEEQEIQLQRIKSENDELNQKFQFTNNEKDFLNEILEEKSELESILEKLKNKLRLLEEESEENSKIIKEDGNEKLKIQSNIKLESLTYELLINDKKNVDDNSKLEEKIQIYQNKIKILKNDIDKEKNLAKVIDSLAKDEKIYLTVSSTQVHRIAELNRDLDNSLKLIKDLDSLKDLIFGKFTSNPKSFFEDSKEIKNLLQSIDSIK